MISAGRYFSISYQLSGCVDTEGPGSCRAEHYTGCQPPPAWWCVRSLSDQRYKRSQLNNSNLQLSNIKHILSLSWVFILLEKCSSWEPARAGGENPPDIQLEHSYTIDILSHSSSTAQLQHHSVTNNNTRWQANPTIMGNKSWGNARNVGPIQTLDDASKINLIWWEEEFFLTN